MVSTQISRKNSHLFKLAVSTFGFMTLTTMLPRFALASRNVQGVANISSTRKDETIIHTCATTSYEACTLYIGTADLDTTIRSDGKVIIGSARQRLKVEADFVQVAATRGRSELSGTNGVWIQSDVGTYSKIESESGNITVDGDVSLSFLTALQGRVTVNGDLIDAARSGEVGITAQEVTVTGDFDPEYTAILELAGQ